ncbi:alpha-1,4-galacturonosyltransferase [Klebsormidium nitens]|uniref:Hexosyltransferase n=1 Tax=Klebsormidium nitens TaxID=105231 RepID=A0A1Y1HZH3_KLENI|nr:alpha-1,4-galacturonosyltransferase [Klebsormidium nitens]|eukprot:GAQ81927.1 alpha-1,4-galacturonosyltransferase [Klebsormidium nitens]
MRRITITAQEDFHPMGLKSAPACCSYSCVMVSLLGLALILPMLFITTAIVKLDSIDNCIDGECYTRGRKMSPTDRADELVTGLLDVPVSVGRQLNEERTGVGGDAVVGEREETIDDLIAQVSELNDDSASVILKLRALVEVHEGKARMAKLQRALYRHFASKGVPKGLHCLSLRLTADYSTNPEANRPLAGPEEISRLTDNSLRHFVLLSDNVLATSVVVNSTVTNAKEPEKVVFHVVTDETTYSAMHAWFALFPPEPATIEVRGVHEMQWLTAAKAPVLDLMENSLALQKLNYGDRILEEAANDPPQVLAAKLQARSPKYISIMNHLRMYLPEVFPELDRIIFLDDDVVVQKDLTGLWEMDMRGKVNAGVETCRGADRFALSKQFRSYFNFSNPLIAEHFAPETCAWAFGLNVFDLKRWRESNITETYHHWQKQNMMLNMTLWRLGTLPPALIAFYGHTLPLDHSWHMLGLGYQPDSSIEVIKSSAVIHYNGPAKPWLDMAFTDFRSYWTRWVDYGNEFVHQCNIFQMR